MGIEAVSTPVYTPGILLDDLARYSTLANDFSPHGVVSGLQWSLSAQPRNSLPGRSSGLKSHYYGNAVNDCIGDDALIEERLLLRREALIGGREFVPGHRASLP